jgi:hypothetical protein
MARIPSDSGMETLIYRDAGGSGMVTLRLLAMDDVSFQSWDLNSSSASGDIWVVFSEKHLFPEFLKHFYHSSDRDQISMPCSENFF